MGERRGRKEREKGEGERRGRERENERERERKEREERKTLLCRMGMDEKAHKGGKEGMNDREEA